MAKVKHVWANAGEYVAVHRRKDGKAQESRLVWPWLSGILLLIFAFCIGGTVMKVLLSLGLIGFLVWLLLRREK